MSLSDHIPLASFKLVAVTNFEKGECVGIVASPRYARIHAVTVFHAEEKRMRKGIWTEATELSAEKQVSSLWCSPSVQQSSCVEHSCVREETSPRVANICQGVSTGDSVDTVEMKGGINLLQHES